MDLNNGDLIGWSFIASSSQDSKRVTGASAFLTKSQRPENLTIFTETRIIKIEFEGSRAIAVVKEDGTKSIILIQFLQHLFVSFADSNLSCSQGRERNHCLRRSHRQPTTSAALRYWPAERSRSSGNPCRQKSSTRRP